MVRDRKPTQNGVYKVITDRALRGYSYFLNGKWGSPAEVPEKAESNKNAVSTDLIIMWQGILPESHDPRLTPWLDAKIHAPVREGVYKTFHHDSDYSSYSYFKDDKWYLNSSTADDAYTMFVKRGISVTKPLYWRGLIEKHT